MTEDRATQPIPDPIQTDTPEPLPTETLEPTLTPSETYVTGVVEKPVTCRRYSEVAYPLDPSKFYGIKENHIVISLDDCYYNDRVRSIFQILVKHGATATFFPNTKYLGNDEDTLSLWREIYNAGFEIGYHTTNHEAGMNQAQLAEDFQHFSTRMRYILDDDSFCIALVRPPYGVWDDNWHAWAASHGLINLAWNMGPEHDIEYAQAKLDEGVSPIVLLHPSSQDLQWLEENIAALIELANNRDGAVGSYFDSLPKNSAE